MLDVSKLVIAVKQSLSGMFFTKSEANAKFYHSGNDGSGSGLDADKLDGLDSTAFLKVANNLSDVTAITARTNLSVYSKSDLPVVPLVEYLPFGYVTDGSVDYHTYVQGALTAAAGKRLVFPTNIVVASSGELVMSDGTHLDLAGSTLKFTGSGQVRDLSVGNYCVIVNGKVDNQGTSPSGSGEFQCPILLGNYETGAGVHGVVINNIELDTNRSNGNGILVVGDCYNILIDGISVADNTVIGRPILIHWGGFTNPSAGTTHPRNITVRNVYCGILGYTGNEDGCPVYISSSFNIHVSNIYAREVQYGIIVYAGDYGNKYAPAEYKDMIGYGITVENITAEKTRATHLRIQGHPRLEGANLDLPVHFKECAGRGTKESGGTSGSGVQFDDCAGAILENCKMTHFYYHGAVSGSSAHRIRIIGGEYANNGWQGIRVSNTGGVAPEDWIIDGAYIHNNHELGTQTDERDRAGITLQDCLRARVIRCRFGSASETHKYSIYVDPQAVYPELEGNYTDSLASGGVAYQIGTSSTNYAIGAHGRNNHAASGITEYGGSPLFEFRDDGTKVCMHSSSPTGGSWNKGDTVYYKSPGSTNAIGAICTVSGSPGTWKKFGIIES